MVQIAKPLIGKEERDAVDEVLKSGNLASGKKVEEFERKFADFTNTKYAIATNSGTSAIHTGLLSLNIRKGNEVIIPGFSFIATANTILHCGAKPVFCDINIKTYNINPDKIERLITNKTKAIMPVHLFGQPADMKNILRIAKDYNLKVICDACQAHGAEYKGKKIGGFGDLECFSFYPTKNMTTGEGGIITTNNKDIYERAKSIINHGRKINKRGYIHWKNGYNYRMTDIAATIGLEQLKKLPEFNKRRRENASYYNKYLTRVGLPYVLRDAKHIYHQYTIKTNYRKLLLRRLEKNNIGYGIYYPHPLYYYPHLKKYKDGKLQYTEEACKKVVSIPVHPSVTKNDLKKVTRAI